MSQYLKLLKYLLLMFHVTRKNLVENLTSYVFTNLRITLFNSCLQTIDSTDNSLVKYLPMIKTFIKSTVYFGHTYKGIDIFLHKMDSWKKTNENFH